jgi:Mce-associated membrane protein
MTEPQDPETAAANEPTEAAPARRPSPVSRARRAAAAGAAAAPSAARPSPRPSPKPEQAAESVLPANTATPEQAAKSDKAVKPAKPAQTPGTAPIWFAAVLLAAVLALGTVCWLLATHQGGGTSRQGRERAMAAAKSDSALVLSYNYQHLDKDRDAALPHLTGRFAADYKKSMDSVIKDQAPKVKAVVEGQVDSAGLEAVSGSGNQITVIVFGQQKVTNTTLTQPRTDIVRLRVILDRVGKDWKISKVDPI